jgi:hypothetical protein
MHLQGFKTTKYPYIGVHLISAPIHRATGRISYPGSNYVVPGRFGGLEPRMASSQPDT